MTSEPERDLPPDSFPPPPESLGLLSTRAPVLVRKATETLLARFEEHGYNPTPIIDLGVIIAAADGEITETELEALRSVVGTLLGEKLKPEVVAHLVQASYEVLKQAGTEPRVRLIAEILDDCHAVEQGLIVALAVAFADRGVNEAEKRVLSMLARAARLPEARVDELVAEVGSAVKRK
jgi:tellurite resistance protein